MMNTIAFPTLTTESTTTFVLTPSHVKAGNNKALYFYGMVLFPLSLASIMFYNVFDLRGTDMLIAVGVSLLALVNIYFIHLRNQAKAKDLMLKLDFGQAILIQNDQQISRTAIEDLKVSRLYWGDNDNNSLPAIQIEGGNFPKISVGYIQRGMDWKGTQAIMDCTDFTLNSEKEWRQLLALLSK